MIKKADIILIIIIIILSFLTTFLVIKDDHSRGNNFEIYVDNQLYGEYSLSEFQEIQIKKNGNVNKIIVDKHGVKMVHSSCKNKNCVNQGYIKNKGSDIVCLPNRIIIKIKGENGDIDSISK